MIFKRALKEATKIISVNIEKGTDQNPHPKIEPGSRETVDLEKSKLRVVPKILDKDMKHMEYYVPDLPEGAWESIPQELRKFYKDFMNSYAEVAWLPHENLSKWRSQMKLMMKKYPDIKWKKISINPKQLGKTVGKYG